MNIADLPNRQRVQAHCAGLLAVLGSPADDFRPVWDGASRETRRLFLTIAKLPSFLVDRPFSELKPQTRIELRGRVEALRDWLNKVVPE